MTWKIDDVDLSTLAFNISNRSAGWKVPPKRGDNLTIPGRNGTQWLPNKAFDQGALTLNMWVNGADPETGLIPEQRTMYQQVRDNLDRLTALFAQSSRLLQVTQISGTAYGLENVMTNPNFSALAPTATTPRTYRNVILNPAMRRTGQVTQAKNLFSNPNVITGQNPLWVPVYENIVPDPNNKYNRSVTPASIGGGNYWAPPNFENYNSGDGIGGGWIAAPNTTPAVANNTANDQTSNPQGGTKVFRVLATAALAANALLGTRTPMYVAPGYKPLFRIRMRRGMTGSTVRGVQIRLTTFKSDNTTVVATGSWQTFSLPAYTGGGPADWIDAIYNPGSLVMDSNAYSVRVEFRTNEAWLINDALILDLGMLNVQGTDLQGTYFDGIAGPFYDGDSPWGGSWSGTAGTTVSRWNVNTDARWVPAAPTGANSAYWRFADRTPSDVNGTTLGFVAYGFTTGGTQSFTHDLLTPTQTLPYTLYFTARALTGATCTVELLKKGTADADYVVVGSPVSVVGTCTPAGGGTKMTGSTVNYLGPTYRPDAGDLFRLRVTVPVRIDGYHIFQFTTLGFYTSGSGNFSGDTGTSVNSQYSWDGTSYNSRSIRSHRQAKRVAARHIVVSGSIPTGYTQPINTVESICLADGDPTMANLDQINLPATNRGLYIRSFVIGALSPLVAAGTPNPSVRIDATFVDSGGGVLGVLSGATVLLNLSVASAGTFLPVTLTVPPESVPTGSVGVQVSIVHTAPRLGVYIEIGEIGVYDTAITPARLGMPDYFSNTATAIWLGPADDAVSEYRITAPLGYTTGSAVPYAITGTLAVKSSLANSATVTIGHPLGTTYPGGRYLAGLQAACRAEDSTGTKVSEVVVSLAVAFYAAGVQVSTTAIAQLSGNEIFDYFQGTFDVPGDFDEIRIIFTAQPPVPSSITGEIKSIYLYDNTVLSPMARLGGNKVLNPDFNDAQTFWGFSGASPTRVNTTKGPGYTLGIDTRLSGRPFTVTPNDQLNVALWGADGLRSTIYWNAVIARRNLAPNPSFEASYIGYAGGSALIAQDSAWFLNGGLSAKVTPNGIVNSSSLYLFNPDNFGASLAYLHLIKGRTYTISATLHLTVAQTGTLDAYARSINVGVRRGGATVYNPATNVQAPNVPGDYRLALTFTVPTDVQDCFVRLMNGSANIAEPVWWDSVLIEEAAYPTIVTNWLKSPSAEAVGLPDWAVASATKQRVSTAWPGKVGGPNLVTQGANGTFEGGNITGWRGVGAAPPTLAADATVKRSGSHSLKVTWATTGSWSAGAQAPGIPTVIGQQYTAEMWIYVPTGGPQVSLYVDNSPSYAVGNIITVKDQWALSTVTFTATATTVYVEVDNRADAIAGQICYVDEVRLGLAGNSLLATAGGNFLTAGVNGTFEGDINGWNDGGAVSPATMQYSTARARSGTGSMLVTWPNAAIGASVAIASVGGLTVGKVYTVQAWVFVPAPSIGAGVSLVILGGSNMSAIVPVTTPDAWVRLTRTFTATATTAFVGVYNGTGATTSGMTCNVDDVAVYDATIAPLIYPRSTGPGGMVPVKPGDLVYGQVTVGSSVDTLVVAIAVGFYDASANFLSSTRAAAQTIPAGGSAALNITSDAVPQGATGALLLIYPTLQDGTAPPGMGVLIDGAIVQVNQRIIEYFDGSTTGPDAAYSWTGTPQASPSIRQPTDYFDSGFKEVSGALYRWNNTVSEKITFTAATETEIPVADGALNLAQGQITVPAFATTAMLLVENPQVPVRWSEIDPALTWDQIDPVRTWAKATGF